MLSEAMRAGEDPLLPQGSGVSFGATALFPSGEKLGEAQTQRRLAFLNLSILPNIVKPLRARLLRFPNRGFIALLSMTILPNRSP
jgi:hypothetical protein